MKLVAVCEKLEERRRQFAEEFGVATYADFEEFLGHDMDAVILANYFHQHAPFALRALRAGLHVLSEIQACHTLAEGVALVREVEKSGRVYMVAENCPYLPVNMEMRRLYRKGAIGMFQYGEAEYCHPMSADERNRISPGVNHWRNWIPATYYCEHCLGPILSVTETMPVKVNGFCVPPSDDDPVRQRTAQTNDSFSMVALRMDTGAVVKLIQWNLRGHVHWFRFQGSKGLMENLRRDEHWLRVVREQYHERRTVPHEVLYKPDFPTRFASVARKTGHGGADFFADYEFAQAVRTGEPPFFDVHRGVAMAAVGILAYRSALSDSAPIDIPDFHKESDRRKYDKDHWTPDPDRRTPDQPWPSILGEIRPPKQALAYARKVWREMGIEEE